MSPNYHKILIVNQKCKCAVTSIQQFRVQQRADKISLHLTSNIEKPKQILTSDIK